MGYSLTTMPWQLDAQNKPYDQFVRELLTSNGSNFRVGPANYIRAVANRNARTVGEATALVFLGARLSSPAATRIP